MCMLTRRGFLGLLGKGALVAGGVSVLPKSLLAKSPVKRVYDAEFGDPKFLKKLIRDKSKVSHHYLPNITTRFLYYDGKVRMYADLDSNYSVGSVAVVRRGVKFEPDRILLDLNYRDFKFYRIYVHEPLDVIAKTLHGTNMPFKEDLVRVLKLPNARADEDVELLAKVQNQIRAQRTRVRSKLGVNKMNFFNVGQSRYKVLKCNEIAKEPFARKKKKCGYIGTSGAGPCVILTLYHKMKLGAVAHVDPNYPGMIYDLVKEVKGYAPLKEFESRVIGGHTGYSERTIFWANRAMEENNVKIVEKDILGQDVVRSIVMDLETGEVFDKI